MNCSVRVFVNGHLKIDQTIKESKMVRAMSDVFPLERGLNRMVIACTASDEDISLRPVFRDTDWNFIDNIRYQLTIDEVDPK